MDCNHIQKAKAEQKYFNLMKIKDGVESERKALTRNMEKQAKVMEKLQEGERALSNQIVSLIVSLSGSA
jgi:E3 ubiquitin-protein ligase BRE1